MTKKKQQKHQKKGSQDQNESITTTNNDEVDEPTTEIDSTSTITETIKEEVEEKQEEKVENKQEEEKVEEKQVKDQVEDQVETKQEEDVKKEDDELIKQEEEQIKKVEEPIKSQDKWSDDEDIDVPIVESGEDEQQEPPQQQQEEEEQEEKKYIIKQKKFIKVKKPKKIKKTPPTPIVEPTPPVQQQSSGWGGWFSSIGNAVSNTITQIARVDLDDSEDEESEEEVMIEEEIELTKNEYDLYMEHKNKTRKRNVDGTTGNNDSVDETDDSILNAIDNGVFKTADMIADSLYFAGSLFSSGFKSVQDNANLENVKGITQEVSNISSDTKNKISNSELYGKASQMMDSSVDVLESVGQRAYSMFSSQMKNKPSDDNNGNNINSNSIPPKQQQSPKQQQQTSPIDSNKTTTTNTTTTSTSNKSIKPIVFNIDDSIFEAGEFDSSKCSEHFNISKFIQDIEKVSVESTMKSHQINRKVISISGLKSSVEPVLNEIKDLFESDEIPTIDQTTFESASKSFSNIHVFELEKKYAQFFDKLQEFTPQLKSQSIELGLCRGLEKIYQLTSIGLELISTIAISIPDEKLQSDSTATPDSIKEWAILKSNEILFTITKITQDIKLISSMLAEIIKSKQQNPNSRKLLNTLHVETTNAISYIQDTKGGLVNVCQIMYLNEIKLSLKGPTSPITPIRKQQQRN